ncbi:uncharacterized protein TRUGW13939_03275 [Talaromyces rugulosus]|uniref:F-box domain-containing protein n=1 Tax=Talaromyces rugulosus TaxID=121627 RepID=A0A7H8QRV5_TALRU|nr:uncharacterized protein TRUGW13939_03275 [Talaromyces rugulosus]QKX56175.1 hypothetical protein TRUGW13939_03275 [Talaromyces rugulosus]
MQPYRKAQTRALAIPEIVTSILHEMDMRTLIAAQRVCRMWADLIHESRSLQQALFFLPVDGNMTVDTTKTTTWPRVYNPLLAETFPSFFPSPRIVGTTTRSRNDGTTLKGNPIEYTNLTSLAFAKDPTKQKMYFRPEASWRRMLTTQPPIYTIGSFSSASGMLGMSWTQEKAAHQEGGLRMATLFETMVNLGRFMWNGSLISISFGGGGGDSPPVNAHSQFISLSTSMDSDRVNADWAKMLFETDLVIVTSEGGSCTDPDGPEDPNWVKSPDEIVWEGICECYEELGLTLYDLPMDVYNKGMEYWN